jgi:hypothetical protein
MKMASYLVRGMWPQASNRPTSAVCLRWLVIVIAAQSLFAHAVSAQTQSSVVTSLPKQARRSLLTHGFSGVAVGLVGAGIVASVSAALATDRCTTDRTIDSRTTVCGADRNRARAAAIGGAIGYAFWGSAAISAEIRRAGKKAQLQGTQLAVVGATIPTLLVALGLSAWAMSNLADRGPRTLAPVGVVLSLAVLALPPYAGYLSYAASHRRHARDEAKLLTLYPAVTRDSLGLLLGGRF